ncbi:hypothetical protein H2202_003843 [Exophiala xenobiotica]|nr:hypothetical protein H2202_003843 [Exophiala xenobiotica]
MSSNENILGIRDALARGGSSTRSGVIHQTTPTKSRKRSAEPMTPEEKEAKRQRREALQELKAAEARNLIVVGLDFGTTYTGSAYGSSRQTWNEIAVVNKWTGGPNDNSEKTPTRIAYAEENNIPEDKWGDAVKPGLTACQWTKLLLDGKFKKADFDDPLLEGCLGSSLMHLPEGKTAQEVVTDFLTHVYRHLLRYIEQKVGKTLIEQTSFRFVVTKPATWSLAAQQATRQAARDAGFGSRPGDDVQLIDEPEAAAICAIKMTNAAFEATPFQQNTCAMVVDMGGGTVDLCTYRISKTEPLQLEEACVGQGAKCGATSVDRALHELLQERFGTAFSNLPLAKIGAGSVLMNAFEAIKRDFTGAYDEGHYFELPLKMRKLDEDDPAIATYYDFEEDMIKLTGKDMEAMFETVLTKTEELINNQIKENHKAKKPALRRSIQTFIDTQLKGKLELVVPQYPWSAIARGAAIAGLERSVVAFRRCRDHIGFSVHVKFDPAKHGEEDRYECPLLGPRARDQMRWHITRGEKISANLKRSIDCYVVVEGTDMSKPEYVVYQDLYGCSEDQAPERKNDKVFPVGRIKIDLTLVVKAERTQFTSGRRRIPSKMDFDLKLELSIGSDKGVLIVTARTKTGRKKIGFSTVEYESDPAYNGVLVSSDD